MKKLFTTLAMAAILLSGCLNNSSNDKIKIATKPMTEQFILAEMLSLIIEHDTNLKTEITKGIGGGTANIHPALLKGEFDLYPEYTGTAWLYVLKKQPEPDAAKLQTELAREYAQQFKLEWVGQYGFNNTFGLAVRQDVAEKYKLNSYSDLSAVSPKLKFGAEPDFFEREDGYNALAQTYGLKFAEKRDLDIGLKYPALKNSDIDVMNIFTTDGQLATASAKVLQDDKHFYPDYHAGTVVRSDTLVAHPELKAALMKMNGLISNKEMSRMNHAVESEKRNEREVAAEFLKAKGVLK